MAEGDVADARAEQAGGQGLGVADDQAALGILGHRPAGHVRMADGNQRLAFLTLAGGRGDQPFMHLADAPQVVVAQLRTGDFGRAQERQGQAPRLDLALGIGQRQQQALDVQLPIVEPQHSTQCMGAQASHQRRRQFDTRAGVVITGDHHDGQVGVLFMGADDEIVQPFLGFDRRVDGVEDVAGDQQHVGFFVGQLTQQPVEETGVFEITFLAVKVLPQVPVGGVKQTQGKLQKTDDGRGEKEGG